MTENCIKKLVTASEDLADLNQVIIRDRSNEKSNKTSIIHNACRSTDKDNLTCYQSKIDNLLNSEIIHRTYVPDDKVKWEEELNDYEPVEYTANKVLEQPIWADNADPKLIVNWNNCDGNIDRRSFMGHYQIIDGRPINIVGRTGISGRGQLGKWGPNHAADPVVTRWKRDGDGNKIIDEESQKPILQFVSIQRLDTRAWAIPGGMCDPGENISLTLKREFMEEATDCLGENVSKREEMEKHLEDLFKVGDELYRGYVDDPRNTDNAWMETTVYNFHDEDDKTFGDFKLSAGDDAGQVTWMTINKDLELYASHKNFVKLAVNKLDAHW